MSDGDMEYFGRCIDEGIKDVVNLFGAWKKGRGLNPVQLLDALHELSIHYRDYNKCPHARVAARGEAVALEDLIDDVMNRTKEEAKWHESFSLWFLEGGRQ